MAYKISKEKIILVLFVVGFLIVIIVLGLRSKEPEELVILDNQDGFFDIRSVDWTDPDNPMQSTPLKEKDIPKETIRISVDTNGFTPQSFEVKKGEKVVLNLNSIDQNWTHLFMFKDKSLASVFMEVGPGQKRMITFYAPDKEGEYEFFCRVPGHEARGETGKMIVK